MQLRHLGLGQLATSAIGLGCMGLSQGYGPADDNDSVRAIHQALETGITMLDTQLALAWLLAQGPDVAAIPGSRRPDRIAENAGAADVRLSEADLRRLEESVPRSAWAGDRTSFAEAVTTRA
jgi:aryl-alcohol dehydrogenase-like predicted oxidoreductase